MLQGMSGYYEKSGVALQRLSSGLRINSAKDAGLDGTLGQIAIAHHGLATIRQPMLSMLLQ
jgi:hypothetical protein